MNFTHWWRYWTQPSFLQRRILSVTVRQHPDSPGWLRISATACSRFPAGRRADRPDSTAGCRMARDGRQEVLRRLSAGQGELLEIGEQLADKHRLSEVLIRNRKVLVGGFMPRTAFRWEVDLSPEEREALQAVEDYVRFGYQFAADTSANAIGFLMVIFQKLTASSIAAIRESLLRRRDKVQARSSAGNASSQDMEDLLDEETNAGRCRGKGRRYRRWSRGGVDPAGQCHQSPQ